MSLAIEFGDESSDQSLFFYFDAVTSYSTEYKGKVTEHPIDGGATIADHFVKMNPRILITGVVTGADITVGNENIQNQSGDTPLNTKAAPDAVSVDTSTSAFNSLIPASISQFFSPQEPSVVLGDSPSNNAVEEVRQALEQLISGEKYNEISKTYTNNMQLLKLYEYSGSVIRTIITNLVAVGIAFREDADTGDALYCDIVLEQVKFATSSVSELPADVANSLQDQAASLQNKGKQDSSVTELGEEEGTAFRQLLLGT